MLSASALDTIFFGQNSRADDLTPSIVPLLRLQALSFPEIYHNQGIQSAMRRQNGQISRPQYPVNPPINGLLGASRWIRFWWTILVHEQEMCVAVSVPFVFIRMEFLPTFKILDSGWFANLNEASPIVDL